MSFQPGAMLYTQSFGSRPENVEVPHIDTRAPTVNDVGPFFPIGKHWIFVANAEYVLVSVSSIGGTPQANWILTADIGTLDTLTGDSGGAISPSIGNITLAGTGGQITTTGSGSSITFSIPAAFIAPGSIASTTTLTAGTNLVVTDNASIGGTLGVTGLTTLGPMTQVGTANINATGAATTNIATGGTGALHLGNATGNTALTGTLTTSGAITITLGALTLTNGNIVLVAAGNKINHTSVATTTAAGANSVGSVTLVAGTATVATTNVTANSLIKIWRQSVGATGAAALGQLSIGTIVAGTSFIINAWETTSATTLQTTDVSVIGWEIIN
jgi:hypothetical protein